MLHWTWRLERVPSNVLQIYVHFRRLDRRAHRVCHIPIQKKELLHRLCNGKSWPSIPSIMTTAVLGFVSHDWNSRPPHTTVAIRTRRGELTVNSVFRNVKRHGNFPALWMQKRSGVSISTIGLWILHIYGISHYLHSTTMDGDWREEVLHAALPAESRKREVSKWITTSLFLKEGRSITSNFWGATLSPTNGKCFHSWNIVDNQLLSKIACPYLSNP